MTLAISPEQAEHIYNSRNLYATVEDFKDILNKSIANRFEQGTLAIDALEIPVEKTTTFPYWAIMYLHAHRDKVIEESDLLVAAISVGYRTNDFRFVKNFLKESQSNVGYWYEPKEKKTYYKWYRPNELTKKVQECLDRGEEW